MNEKLSFICDYNQKALYQVTDIINNCVLFRVYMNDFYETEVNFLKYTDAYNYLIK